MAGYWLVKSEPAVFAFDDLCAAPSATTAWDGVRNYQARNFMRDQMAPGDPVLFYHSSIPTPAVVGLAEVASASYPDPTQFQPHSPYFDPRASREKPRWFLVELRAIAPLPRAVTRDRLKADAQLADLPLLRRGNRLSILPLSAAAFARICELGGLPSTRLDTTSPP